MRMIPLFLFVLLLAACGGEDKPDSTEDGLKTRAKVAELNLVKIRDAVVAYHEKHGKKPESVSDLDDFGAGLTALAASDDYADLGYSFYNVEFKDGKLARGWFLATPMLNKGALKVRMNGVSGNFDYVPHDQDFGQAPDDNGWDEE